MVTSNLTIKFDLRAFVPNQDLSSGTVQMDGSYCADKSFPITLLAENLTPGNRYRATYELISPFTEQKVFNPSLSDLYASYGSQNFITAVILPKGPNKESNTYVLKATLTDVSENSTGNTASTQIRLICGIDRQIFDVELLDPDTVSDNLHDIGNCENGFPLIGKINNSLIGKEYSYKFYDTPSGSISFEKREGSVFAGDTGQNFNSRVALTGYPYAFVHATVTEKDTAITRTSNPLLLKCFQTEECDVILPTGIDYSINVNTLRKCSSRGITNNSISMLYGGGGFSIGDKLTTVGGGGYGAEIEILFGGITVETFSSFYGGSGFNIGDLIEVTGGGGSGGLIKIISGGLTNASISSLNGCSGFNIGDLFTTSGGKGKDALITVTATGVNGSISTYNVLNSGHGFTSQPTGIVPIKGVGSCLSATFNADNFTIPAAGGITDDSLTLAGGTGYNINEILNVIGGGGTGAQIKIISGTLTDESITNLFGGTGYSVGDLLTTTGGGGSDVVIRVTAVGPNGQILDWEILNGGYGFTSAPTGLVPLTGSGTGASFVANADNFAITAEGGITEDSISDLIGTGSGYSVGDELVVIGGGGSGAVIIITSVSSTGEILSFVIKYPGSGYNDEPTLVDAETQTAIVPQPSWDTDEFTDESYIILNAGSGYTGTPTALVSTNGNGNGSTIEVVISYGHGADFDVDITEYTDPAFIVENTGSGYTSAPTGTTVKTGDGSGTTAVFNDENFTIPCAGGITYESISGLIGKTSFVNGEELVLEGGGGSGGRIKISGISNTGSISSFLILNSGCGYVSAPTLKRINGTVIAGVVFNVELFTKLAVNVIDAGAGFAETPTGLETLTGKGNTESITVSFDETKFIELAGDIPSAPILTPTPTPSASSPATCNDLQTAGGQNTISYTRVSDPAISGQGFLIIENTDGVSEYTVVSGPGIPTGTYITSVTNWFANYNDRIIFKKITLSNTITQNIPSLTNITLYSPDIRLIKVPYWPGNMTFTYNAFNVPDRFRVFLVSMDSRVQDSLLFDSGYVGNDEERACNDVPLSGPGYGSVNVFKSDGSTFVKVIVEASCDRTAWEYTLSCPRRVVTTVTSTPTVTPTRTPTPTITQTRTPTPTITPTKTVTPTVTSTVTPTPSSSQL